LCNFIYPLHPPLYDGAALKSSDSCVYTILLGDYELLNEQPVATRSDVRFICLTDNPNLKSESWDTRLTTPIFPNDPIRSHRDIKIRPHVHLPDFARSVYIDNSVVLKEPPERLFEMAAASPSGLLVPPHSYRETVLDEFLEVVRAGLDESSRIFEQLNHYLLSCPEALEEHPWWAGFMVRDHGNVPLRRALEIWALHVMRYARRDQLSLNVALRAAGIQPLPLAIDNFESEFHSWPHARARDRNRVDRNLAADLMPLPGRIRQLQTAEIENGSLREQLAELSAAYESLLRSRSWRLTGPLRRLVNRLRTGAQQEAASPECSPAPPP
jgi:hypothetical protein